MTALGIEERLILDLLRTKARQGWLNHGVPRDRCETVRQHSVKVAAATRFYTTGRREYNAAHAVTMAYVHDMAESLIPDFTPFDPITKEEKYDLEEKAVMQLTATLGTRGVVLRCFWLEYAEGLSRESQLVHQLDKFDAAVQALEYEKQGYTVQDFYPYTRERLHNAHLLSVFDTLQSTRPQNSYRTYFTLLQQH
jgi:putative hydrolases of HD superfamily